MLRFEKTANPFSKPPNERANWIKELEEAPVGILDEGDEVDVL